MINQGRRIAGCHLLLRGNRWMPISVNRALGAKDRCSPGGAVISAYLSALVEGDTIIGWIKNSAFSVQEVLPDGKLPSLDLTPAKLALQGDSADMKAGKAGVVGISSLIAGVAFRNKILETFRRRCAKPHSSARRYRYWTEFRGIPLSGCACTIAETRKFALRSCLVSSSRLSLPSWYPEQKIST
jgi:hypothetical protein